ncbi:MAG: Fpg/Nei family DNA glycosylase [Acidobacteria bacterium]|nr:Fpg/Nei family DNA glycosylase [Acidobacteriota bacterium]MCA1611009.1 Fpg/Nei family DNA glycosylase [Acidobacteriota bacterium]
MPEGDTILRAARTLARALEGKEIVRWWSPLPTLSDGAFAGSRVVRVEARGKHLLMHFDDGRVLHSHMQMVGSWHVYRPGETWRKPERLARAVLQTVDFVAVCFNAPVLEILTSRGLSRHERLARLGPDLLSESFDPEAARVRLRAIQDLPIGEALLAQNALAGIGNIYKSESLFAAQTSPFLPVALMSDAEIDRIVHSARQLMLANVFSAGRARTTRAGSTGPRYSVYRRSGLPCLSCGTRIRMRRQGTSGRSTYWCPCCQPARGAAPPGEELK